MQVYTQMEHSYIKYIFKKCPACLLRLLKMIQSHYSIKCLRLSYISVQCSGTQYSWPLQKMAPTSHPLRILNQLLSPEMYRFLSYFSLSRLSLPYPNFVLLTTHMYQSALHCLVELHLWGLHRKKRTKKLMVVCHSFLWLLWTWVDWIHAEARLVLRQGAWKTGVLEGESYLRSHGYNDLGTLPTKPQPHPRWSPWV